MSGPLAAARDRLALVLAVALVAVIVTGAVVLVALHEDLTGYAAILAGPVVSGLVGLLLSRRVAVVQELGAANRADLLDVKSATNGLTTGRFDSVDAQLVDAAQHRSDNDAAAVSADQDAREFREQ